LEVDVPSHQRGADSRNILGNPGIHVLLNLWLVVLGNVSSSEGDAKVRPAADRYLQFMVFSVPPGPLRLEPEQIVTRVFVEHVSQSPLDIVIVVKELSSGINGNRIQAVLGLAKVISLVIEEVDRILIAYII